MNDSAAGEADQRLHTTDPRQLEAATAANHRELYVQRSLAAGGEVRSAEGVTWTYSGAHGDAMILFPELAPERAGDQLDEIIQFYRDRQPRSLVGCWSLEPPRPADLGVRLLARGFQPGWLPCWMALDLAELRADHVRPAPLQIELLERAPSWEAPDLPYYDRAMAAVYQQIAARQPRQLWHFVATLDGQVVGQSMLFVTRGPLGVAGIYDVGVVPAARGQGIGKAIVAAACLRAREEGCAHATLNATGERMYRQLGFERIGAGLTWWLNVARLEASPPTSDRIALAEAVGRGDLAALTARWQHEGPASLDTPLASGMTLLELAAHARQAAAAEWLVDRGAALDVVLAWQLGWRDRAAALLARDPAHANRRRGELATTPLHEAVERNDLELTRALLAARPDLTITDARFGATALGWARHLGRTALADLIEAQSVDERGHDDNERRG